MGNEEADIDELLAKRIAFLRSAAGLSLDEFASKTGISRATLSRIERSETSPTAQMLGRIAACLGITCSEIFQSVQPKNDEFFPALNRKAWFDKENGFLRKLICPPSSQRLCELTEGRLRPGAQIEYPIPLENNPEEIIYVLSGQLSFFHCENKVELNAGDAYRFILRGPTGFHNTGDIECQYLVILGRKS